MKLYLILASLVAIFVVGGIGMFLTISNTTDLQKSVESSTCLSQEISEKLLENKAYGMMLEDLDFNTVYLCLAKNFVKNNLDEKYTVIGEIQPGILTVEESLPPGMLISVNLTLKDSTKPYFENIDDYQLWFSVSLHEVKHWKFKPAEIWKEGQGWQETQSPLKDDIPNLFIKDLTVPVSTISKESGYYYNYEDLKNEYLRVSPLLKTNMDAFDSDKIKINFFDDSILLEKNYTRYWGDGNSFNWIGKVVGQEASYMVLSVTDEQVRTGHYRIGIHYYHIDYVGNDYSLIVELDNSKRPKFGDDTPLPPNQDPKDK